MVDIQHKNITGADAAHPPFYASESDPTTTLGPYRGWIKPSTGEVKVRNAANDAWIEISGGGGAVSSVFGRTGDILPEADYQANQISYNGFPELDAETVWDALDELAVEKADKVRTISTTAPLTGGGDLSANRTLAISAASETAQGAIELATQTETDTGTDDTRAVTPLKAATRFLAKAGGTLTGFLTLHADPTSALHAVTKQYADSLAGGGSSASETVAGIAEIATQTETDTGTDDARIVTPLKAATRYLSKAGGTLTGFLTLHANPTGAMHAVTKQYADGLVAGGASPASETVAGIAEIATQVETDAGTDDARMVTPLKLANYSGLGGGGSGYRTLVALGSDVSNSTSTFADVTGLSFSVTSGTMYRFHFLITYDAQNAATGSRWSINGPAFTILAYYTLITNAATPTINAQNSYDSGTALTASAAASGNTVVMEGLVKPSASGTLTARFLSEAPGTNNQITAKAGSTLEWW